ncbi:MAG: hypothetical protein H7841_09860 [Magnetospirillum sp. WYHS-4]
MGAPALSLPLDLLPVLTEPGDRLLGLRLSGYPEGVLFNVGTDLGRGLWHVPPPEAPALRLLLAVDRLIPPFRLTATADVRQADGTAAVVDAVVEVGGPLPTEPARSAPAVNLRARLAPIRNRAPSRLEIALRQIPGHDPRDLPEAAAEIARLKEAIGDLRMEMERIRQDTGPAAEAATAAQRDTIVVLRGEAQSLRDRLEELRDARPEALRQAVEEMAPTIAELKEVAQERRDRLEALRSRREESVDRATSGTVEDLGRYKETVQALRDAIEEMVAGFRAEQDALRAEADQRIQVLRQTVAGLRDRLDAARA